MRRSSYLAIRSDFQVRRWTCHVPRAKAVTGMSAVFVLEYFSEKVYSEKYQG